MLFQKYFFKAVPHTSRTNDETYWYMILRTIDDVLSYCKLDTEKLTMAWLRLPEAKKVSHLDVREWVIDTILECKKMSMIEGETASPFLVISEFIDKKTQGMLNTFMKYGVLRVNEVGGYCPLDSFIDTWNCQLIDEIEKDSLGFPSDSDNKIFDTDVIVLENDKSAIMFIENLKSKYIPNGENLNIHAITMLRERDTSYIVNMLSHTKAVAINSMLIDEIQIKKFIKLFQSIKPMDVYLYVYSDGEIKLNVIPEFVELKNKHNIKFIH